MFACPRCHQEHCIAADIPAQKQAWSDAGKAEADFKHTAFGALRCEKCGCGWTEDPTTGLPILKADKIVRPPGSISPDGRDFEVHYNQVADGPWFTDYVFRYLEQAEGRARALLSFGKHSVKILQVIDYHSNA